MWFIITYICIHDKDPTFIYICRIGKQYAICANDIRTEKLSFLNLSKDRERIKNVNHYKETNIRSKNKKGQSKLIHKYKDQEHGPNQIS